MNCMIWSELKGGSSIKMYYIQYIGINVTVAVATYLCSIHAVTVRRVERSMILLALNSE